MAYRDSTVTTTTGTSINATKPALLKTGDILLCYLVTDIGLDGPAPTITPPTGWQLISGSNQGSNSGAPDGFTSWVYWKLANNSEPATWTFSHNGSSTQIVAIVGCWSSRNPVPNFITHGTVNTTGNATPVTVSDSGVTPNTNDDVAIFATGDITVGTDTWSFTADPANYTERQDSQLSFNVATLATRDEVFSGATGTLSLTLTRSAGTGTSGYGIFVVVIPVGVPDKVVKPRTVIPKMGLLSKRTLIKPWADSVLDGALVANSSAISFFQATLLATGDVISNVAGSSQTTENLTAVGQLTGNVSGSSQTVSNPSSGITGSSYGSSSAQGSLLGSGALTARAGGQTTTTETIGATGQLTARVEGNSTAKGLADGFYLLQGAVSGGSQTQTILLGSGQLIGRVTGSEFNVESLQGTGQILSTVTGSSQARGLLTGGYFVSANVTGQSREILVVNANGELRSAIISEGRTNGNLSGHISIEGIAGGQSSSIAILSATVQLSVNLIGNSCANGLITGNAELKTIILSSCEIAAAISSESEQPLTASAFGLADTASVLFGSGQLMGISASVSIARPLLIPIVILPYYPFITTTNMGAYTKQSPNLSVTISKQGIENKATFEKGSEIVPAAYSYLGTDNAQVYDSLNTNP